MQALEKTTNFEYWITLVLMLLFVFVFLLKVIDKKLLKQQFNFLFKLPYTEVEVDEGYGNFRIYQTIVFLFTVFVFALLAYNYKSYFLVGSTLGFVDFSLLFASVLSYFLLKRILEYLLASLFLIKKHVYFFMMTKWNALFSLSFYAYIATILHEYAFLKFLYLLYFIALLILIRFVFLVITNKKLIFSKLFYFILYLCAFEIAPLFLLFKLMF